MTTSSCLNFYLKTFCPLFVVIACRRFWTDLFAICGNTPSRRIQSPTTHYQKTSRRVRVKPKQRRVLHVYGAENENSCGGNELCSKVIEFRQLCSDVSRDSYIAYTSAKPVFQGVYECLQTTIQIYIDSPQLLLFFLALYSFHRAIELSQVLLMQAMVYQGWCMTKRRALWHHRNMVVRRLINHWEDAKL